MRHLQSFIAVLSIFVQNKIISWLKPPRPAGLRVFYIGGYWRGPNDMVAQMLQGLRATGVNVVDFNTDEDRAALETDGKPYDRGTTSPVWLVRGKLFPLIFRFRPHVIICNAGGLSFRPRDAGFLRILGIRLLTMVLSDPEVYEPSTSKIARNFDVVYTVVSQCVELYRRQGTQAYWLPMATNPRFFHPVPARPEYRCDVLVLGAVHADRVEPVRALTENFDTHVYGEGWAEHGIHSRGFLFGEDMLSALNSGSLAVIFSRTLSGLPAVKVGVLDFLAAGGLVVTDDSPDLNRYFVPGKEIIVFKDTGDLLEKIRYYLQHPEETDAIRKAGRAKVINHFTWDRVWPNVLATVTRVEGWHNDPNWVKGYFLQ
ncbi:MAG TPA: glycosyltransferase [Anaerolineales bacterium]|nr:glycosyltransferase [Anaerolineales bacterium]